MFLKNKTSLPVAMPRGHMLDGVFVAAVVTTTAFRLLPDSLERWDGTREARPTDPPPSTDRPLWSGASVTVSGTVFGPGRMPNVAPVRLRAGDVERRLVVSGDRTWVRNGGKLIASVPASWDAMPLAWSLAFGGSFEIPPGPFGPDRLPHPGGRFAYPPNPAGKGFCLNEAQAEGKPLPNIESADEPVLTPLDRPRPACFAPCLELTTLRMPEGITQETQDDPEQMLRLALRTAHAAPGELIFPALPTGTLIEISGVGKSTVRFGVPASPVAVRVRKGASATEIPPAVRCVHIDADEGAVLVTHAHAFSYERAPSWVEVTEG